MVAGVKIIFAGLDSAGKTSFLNTLEEKYSTLTKIKPTLGPDRREFAIFGFTISNWDLGGQKSYRDAYLQEKNRYFASLNAIFFVVDMQDTRRDEEAFSYLKSILDVLTEFNESPAIIVCWHKCDKDIEAKPETIDRLQKLEAQLAQVLGTRKARTFKTSIFDKWTLIKAFSQGLIAVSPKTMIIESQLRDFARKTFSSAVMVLDSNHLLLGSHTTSPALQEVCEAIVPHFATASERVAQYDITLNNLVLSLKPGKYYADMIQGKEMTILFIPLKVGEFTFSLLSLTKNPKTLKLLLKNSEALSSNMQDIIRSFYF
jgi:small GTP-binding protein